MPKRKSDFELPTLDDLFSTQEERDEARLDKIRDIPLDMIDDFPDHPFQVRDNEDMQQLVDSIKSRGVLTPAVLRQKEDGRYEIVSGHRRKRACELAGLDTLRSEIKDLTRDEAIIYMVESNFQRSSILPSEKAFSYKMRLEAMKRQAGRPKKENATPVVSDFERLRSNEELGEQVGESREQIRRYIRLTHLIPELLDLVDEGSIKMRPAVELSYANTMTSASNPDMVGWIKINGTNINYPVMQTPENPDYYLDHDFYKNQSVYGCPYVQANCDVKTPSDNVIVYAHHMNDGSMFANLELFRSKDFWSSHKTISFDTLDNKANYDILAVFAISVDESDKKAFKFYEFVNSYDPDHFSTFIAKCKALSFYETGVSAKYGDKLLTLATCEYTHDNGRLVVVAKRK